MGIERALRVSLYSWWIVGSLSCTGGSSTKGTLAASGTAGASESEVAMETPPEGYDVVIAEALETLSRCTQKRPSAAIDVDEKIDLVKLAEQVCPQDLAWDRLVQRTTAEEDFSRKAHVALGRTCGMKLGHVSPWVRSAAYRCIADYPEGVADPRATLETTLAALNTETDPR